MAAGGILLFTMSLVLALVVGPRPAPANSSSLEVAVTAGSDDAEELLSGWFGSTSSDLELVDENSPQTVGIRFAGLDIPVGATIESAYLRFTVDEAGSGDTRLTIAAEDTGNASTFSSTARVSTRSLTGASVSWSPQPWTVIGSTGPDQTSPNLAEIVQLVIDQPDWTPGNAIAFIFTGTGTRTADSFEGGHPPVLSVSWTAGSETTTTPPTTTTTTTTVPPTPTTTTPGSGPSVFETRIATSGDDVEQRPNGTLYTNSSDLELVEDAGVQHVGIRFQALPVPHGATILTAWIQFTVDEASTAPTQVEVRAHDTADSQSFNGNNDVTGRPTVLPVVSWVIDQWPTVGEATEAQRTPPLTALLQAVVDRTDWTDGNAISFIISGTGRRTAESFDGKTAAAPLLHIEWTTGAPTTTTTTTTVPPTPTTTTTTTTVPPTPTTTTPGSGPSVFETRIATSGDDVEQRPNGTLYTNSSDLELVEDAGVQHVGIRFQALPVPHGATILTAWIQFTVDEASTAPTQVEVRAHDTANSPAFNGNNDVTGRPTTLPVIQWDVEPWPTVGQAAAAQRTPPLTALVQAVVDQPDWTGGNAISFLISGSGRRTAESFDGKPAAAPLLHIEWTTGAPTTTTTTTTVPPTTTTTTAPPTTTTTTTPPGNSPPTVVAQASATIAGGSTTLQATVVDDGLPDPPGSTSVVWEQIAGPATASIADTTAATTTAGLPVAGQYTFRVTVTDGSLFGVDQTAATASADATTHIAVIGDFGGPSERMTGLANMIDAWDPDAVVTVGDNVYSASGYDNLVGRYFHEYMGGYSGSHGTGSPVNRFFPTLGNHDYTDGGLNNYLAFFDVPGPGVTSSNTSGNERYYDVRLGNVHIFIVNSNLQEPDGTGANSVQGQWLRGQLAASDAEWKIVSFHHPPYSSVPNKQTTWMRWPFRDWDVDLVLSGHAHVYERLRVDGLDYVVGGLGVNNSPLPGTVLPDSQAFWSEDTPGALLITACVGALELEYHPVGYGVVDPYTIGTGSCP